MQNGTPLYLVDSRRTSISTLLVVSTYVYLVAFMYLPMTNKKIKIKHHDFQLADAIICAHVSWQSYMSINDEELKWGVLDVDYCNLELIEFLKNDKHDMQILIAKGKDRIHKVFKEKRFAMKQVNSQKKQLLMAPSLHWQKRQVNEYREKFLDDVSSDSANSHSDSESDAAESNDDDDDEKNSMLSFGAIKNLLNRGHSARSFSVFNRKMSKRKQYGSTLEVIEDNGENEQSGKHFMSMLFPTSTKKQSLEQQRTPLLSNYNSTEHGSSLLTTTSAAVPPRVNLDKPPISIHDRQEFEAVYEFNEYPTTHNEHENKYDDGDNEQIESLLTLTDPDPPTRNLNFYHSSTGSKSLRSEDDMHRVDDRQRAATVSSSSYSHYHSKNPKKNGVFGLDFLTNLMPINQSKRQQNKKYIDIILGFRGTCSSVNVKLDLKISRTVVDSSFWYGVNLDESLKSTKEWKKCVRKCIVKREELNPLNLPSTKVHSGFYESFKDIQQQMLQTILLQYYQITQIKKKIPRFYICGHSLGGSLAQLTGLFLDVCFGHKSPIHSLVVRIIISTYMTKVLCI